jgi:glycosyltransferase involved in cell wall biosynthesis
MAQPALTSQKPPTDGRRRLRILMIAYACTPRRGGEHLLGWEWATRLAISHDVTVLTSAERLEESEGQRPAALRMLPVPDRAIRPLKRTGLLGWHLYYLLWHVAATRLGRRLLAREQFDIVHQCTFHTVRVPARLWGGDMPPFIWGPIAGLEQIPLGMIGALGPGGVLELTRLIANWILPRLPPIQRAADSAAAILVSNQDTMRRLLAKNRAKLVYMPANAVQLKPLRPYSAEGDPFTLIAVGQIVRMRAFVLVFEALAALSAGRRQRIHLSFVGGGPDEARLKRIVAKQALSDIVAFHGHMSRAATLDAMSRSHLLVFPSLRDSGSSSIAEAMALGLPVLALDLAGPGAMARGVGFLVTATTPSQTATRIREILDTLIDDRRPLYKASAKGLQRAPDLFDWSRRLAVYETLCYAAVANADRGVTYPDMGKQQRISFSADDTLGMPPPGQPHDRASGIG